MLAPASLSRRLLPPASLSRRLLPLLLAPLALVLALAASAPAQAAPQACSNATAAAAQVAQHSVAEAVRCLVNAERAAKGLPALRDAPALRRAADAHARDMVARSFFAHVSPGGATLTDRARRAGYGGATLGEDIGWGTEELGTPAAIVEAWMHSPPHRAVILHPRFREIGVGVDLGTPTDRSASGAVYVINLGRR
jgi:uncharacterized protein YkwD